MSTIEEIENAVSKLSAEELSAFRKWFERHDAAQWDAQFESDAKSGALDVLAEEAVSDYNTGNAKDL